MCNNNYIFADSLHFQIIFLENNKVIPEKNNNKICRLSNLWYIFGKLFLTNEVSVIASSDGGSSSKV